MVCDKTVKEDCTLLTENLLADLSSWLTKMSNKNLPCRLQEIFVNRHLSEQQFWVKISLQRSRISFISFIAGSPIHSIYRTTDDTEQWNVQLPRAIHLLQISCRCTSESITPWEVTSKYPVSDPQLALDWEFQDERPSLNVYADFLYCENFLSGFLWGSPLVLVRLHDGGQQTVKAWRYEFSLLSGNHNYCFWTGIWVSKKGIIIFICNTDSKNNLANQQLVITRTPLLLSRLASQKDMNYVSWQHTLQVLIQLASKAAMSFKFLNVKA